MKTISVLLCHTPKCVCSQTWCKTENSIISCERCFFPSQITLGILAVLCIHTKWQWLLLVPCRGKNINKYMTNTEYSCYSSCASQREISFLQETNDLSPLFLIAVSAVFVIDDLDRSSVVNHQAPGEGLVYKTGNRWFDLGGPVESTPPAPFSRGYFWEQFCITSEDWGVWLKDSKTSCYWDNEINFLL